MSVIKKIFSWFSSQDVVVKAAIIGLFGVILTIIFNDTSPIIIPTAVDGTGNIPNKNLILKQTLIPINSFTNHDIHQLIPTFPTGIQNFKTKDKESSNIDFIILEKKNMMNTQCSTHPEWPTKFVVPIDYIEQVESVHFLISAGYTPGYNNAVIGRIDLDFNMGQPATYPLILGGNIREWRIGAVSEKNGAVVDATNPDLRQIYIGEGLVGDKGVSAATFDMLTLKIDDKYRNAPLSSITFYDTTQEELGSMNPCFGVVAITVKSQSGN